MARLLDRAMANLPPGLRLVIEESCGGAAPSAGLIWRAELESQPLPGSQVGLPLRTPLRSPLLPVSCACFSSLALHIIYVCLGGARDRLSMVVHSCPEAAPRSPSVWLTGFYRV